MDKSEVVKALKKEVRHLQQAITLLEGENAEASSPSENPFPTIIRRKRKKMSTEARAKISAAQKARWAKTK